MKLTEKAYRRLVFAKAESIKTPEQLTAFIVRVMTYPHDYGTIVIGAAAAMKAALNVVDAGPTGGLTGFQAGCLMWELVRDLRGKDAGPLRLFDYDHVAFPQYDHEFERHEIGRDTAEVIQRRCRARLRKDRKTMDAGVAKRHRAIVAGKWPRCIIVKGQDT